jgi:hypothetical protein
VRKHLKAALRRLEVLLGRADAESERSAASSSRPCPPPTGTSEEVLPCEVLLTTPGLTVGLIGAVVISVWPGPATLKAVEEIGEQLERAVALCPDGFAYLAVVEATTRPPALDARKKIVELLQRHATDIRIYATALQGGLSWIVRPIMTGLSLLAQPPFPMEFFSGTAAASRWLCAQYAGAQWVGGDVLCRAAEQLRERALHSAETASSTTTS